MNDKKMQRNPYEGLRLAADDGAQPIAATARWTVTDDAAERVEILGAVDGRGRYCWGYSVWWADGRHSYRNPDPALGIFATLRDAQLYALGYMGLFARHFREETAGRLRQAEGRLMQAELF